MQVEVLRRNEGPMSLFAGRRLQQAFFFKDLDNLLDSARLALHSLSNQREQAGFERVHVHTLAASFRLQGALEVTDEVRDFIFWLALRRAARLPFLKRYSTGGFL